MTEKTCLMKKLILTLSLLAGPALAENDICADFGRLAEYSMNARLSGVPFSSVFVRLKEEIQVFEEDLRSVQNRLQTPQDVRYDVEQIAFKLATEVYETPRPNGNEDLRIFALDYRSKVEIECYTEISNVSKP